MQNFNAITNTKRLIVIFDIFKVFDKLVVRNRILCYNYFYKDCSCFHVYAFYCMILGGQNE